MILKLRVILDTEEDVIRDLEMDSNSGLQDLHELIINAFALYKGELASFFNSNENWDQGEEIGMLELSLTGSDTTRTMDEFRLKDFFVQKGDKMLYVYDYLKLWTFFVEVIDIQEGDSSQGRLLASVGNRPKEAPNKEMRAETFDDLFDDEFNPEDENFEDEDLY